MYWLSRSKDLRKNAFIGVINKVVNRTNGIRVGIFFFTLFFAAGIPVAKCQDTIVGKPAMTEVVESGHSARKALLLSAVLPGAGQVYNRQAWKVPIIYAAIGGVGYFIYSNYTDMKYYKDEYLYRVGHNDATQYPDDPDMVSTPTSNIYNMYEAYNKTFQLSIIVAAAVYGLNLLDSYVYGHLFDFQISDDISMRVAPAVTPLQLPQSNGSTGWGCLPMASLTLRF